MLALLMLAFPAMATAQPATSAPPRPDARAALLDTLATLTPREPLAAALTVTKTSTSGDEDAPRTSHGSLSVDIRSDALGLHVDVPAAVLRTARAESLAQQKDADAATPVMGLLASFSLMRAESLANYAPGLLTTLADAKLVSQGPAKSGGQAAQLLVFDIPLNLSGGDRENLDDYSGQVKVWVGGDGVPRRVESTYTYKFSKFFISFTSTTQSTCDVMRIGSRLLCSRRHAVASGSGLGRHGKSVTNSVLQPVAAVPAAAASLAPAPASTAPM